MRAAMPSILSLRFVYSCMVITTVKALPMPRTAFHVPAVSSSLSSMAEQGLSFGQSHPPVFPRAGSRPSLTKAAQHHENFQAQRFAWNGLFRRPGPARISPTRPMLASLTPEQEVKNYQIRRQVEDLDELIRTKTDAKRAIEKEVEGLLAQKRNLQMEVNTMAPSLEIASESPLRSLVKACSWRLVAALITLSTSLFFSRDAKMAASIVSSDFLSKAGTMYLGERLWNKVSWGKEAKAGDAASRSIMKAFAWRAFAMVNTLIISIFFAKSVKVAGQIASTDTIIKTSLYVVHERIWSRIDWGRSYDVEYNI